MKIGSSFFFKYQAKYEPEGNRYKMIITSICDPVANVLVFRPILSHFRELTGRDRRNPYVLQISKKRSIIWGILKVLFFCNIFEKKNYWQENRKNVITSNFELKKFFKSHCTISSELNDINEDRMLFLIFFLQN